MTSRRSYWHSAVPIYEISLLWEISYFPMLQTFPLVLKHPYATMETLNIMVRRDPTEQNTIRTVSL